MVFYRVPGDPPPGEQMLTYEALCPKADVCRSYLVQGMRRGLARRLSFGTVRQHHCPRFIPEGIVL
jgi:hypothetical protein